LGIGNHKNDRSKGMGERRLKCLQRLRVDEAAALEPEKKKKE